MLSDVILSLAELRLLLDTKKFSQKATKEAKTIDHMIRQTPL